MDLYVESREQLVCEIVVRDAQRSAEFYQRLGFEIVRNDGDFVILAWEGHHLFLGALEAFHDHEVDHVVPGDPAAFPVAYVRVMVPDVDDYWRRANEMGVPIKVPIADRYYGLRDFIIVDPDGFGIRFASRLNRTQPGS
jgi:catechol 2,3-dioxygenase-like lactoylglutathione lyase family enzyme